jgi:hypothetical protein
MKIEEIRIGSLIEYNGVLCKVYSIEGKLPRRDEKYNNKERITLSDEGGLISCLLEDISPVVVDEDLLVSFFVSNKKALTYNIFLERNRHLAITPSKVSSFVYLCETHRDDPLTITDLICLHNYDYDGLLYAHKIQNLIQDISGRKRK